MADAAVLGLAAMAFSLQFAVTGYVNFAFGEFMTLGALIAIAISGPLHQSLLVSALGAGAVVAILSYGVGQWVYAPFFRRRPQILYILVVGFGLSIILSGIYQLIWGGSIYNFRFLIGGYHAGVLSLTKVQVLALALAALTLATLFGLLHSTRLGKSMRAVADNPNLANVCGLNTNRVMTYTWLITGFVAGIAGVVQGLQTRAFDITLGDTFLYLVIVAVVVAGIGRPLAALIGALIVALGEQLSVYAVGSSLAPVGVFAVLVALILFRPHGLLGGRTTLQNA